MQTPKKCTFNDFNELVLLLKEEWVNLSINNKLFKGRCRSYRVVPFESILIQNPF